MEMFGINATLFWFILAVFFLVLEAITPGFFLFFFGLGALFVSFITWPLSFPPGVQWAIFIAVSIISLLVLRKRLKNIFHNRSLRNNSLEDPVFSGQYIGREVIILEDTNNESGLAELNGTNWQARTKGMPLKAGSRGKVVQLDGIKIIVESLNTTDVY